MIHSKAQTALEQPQLTGSTLMLCIVRTPGIRLSRDPKAMIYRKFNLGMHGVTNAEIYETVATRICFERHDTHLMK